MPRGRTDLSRIVQEVGKDFSDLLDRFEDLRRGLVLGGEVANQHHERRHPFQMANRLPTHGFIGVKQQSVPTLEPRLVDEGRA